MLNNIIGIIAIIISIVSTGLASAAFTGSRIDDSNLMTTQLLAVTNQRISDMNNKIEKLSEAVAQLMARGNSTDEKIGQLIVRADSTDEKIGQLMTRTDKTDQQITGINRRLDQLLAPAQKENTVAGK